MISEEEKTKLKNMSTSDLTYKQMMTEIGWTEKKLRYWFRKLGLKNSRSHINGKCPLSNAKFIGSVFGYLTIKDIVRERYSKGTYTFAVCDCSYCNKKNIKIHLSNILNNRAKSCGCRKDHFKHISGKNAWNWKGCEEIHGTFFSKIKRAAKRRKIPFEITIEFIWKLFLKQKRKCIYTGIELTFGVYDRKAITGIRQTASLDRIDSTKGYIKGNVQWVHKDINWMKQHFTQKKFIHYCNLVTNFTKGKTFK